MAFEFTLDPVLRLRKSYERLERLRLLAIAAMIVRTREEIAAAEHNETKLAIARRESLAKGLLAAEMQTELTLEKARVRARAALLERLGSLQNLQVKQSRAFSLARTKREILERLRETKLQEFRILEGRREQRRLDELHLLRRLIPIE